MANVVNNPAGENAASEVVMKHRVQLLTEFEVESQADIETVANRLRALLFTRNWPKGVKLVEVE